MDVVQVARDFPPAQYIAAVDGFRSDSSSSGRDSVSPSPGSSPDSSTDSSLSSLSSPSLNPRRATKLFLGGLNRVTTSRNVYDYFSAFGGVRQAVVKEDAATKKSRGFGFVEFASVDSVQRVFESAPHFLQDKMITCRVALPRGDSELRPAKPRKLFIGGLPQGVHESEVRAAFEPFGIVESVQIMYDPSSIPTPDAPQRHRGFAFLLFVEGDDAERVVQRRYFFVADRLVEAKPAAPRDATGISATPPTFSINSTLLVSDLPHHIDEYSLYSIFGAFGRVEEVKVLRDDPEATGTRHRGYALITYARAEDALALRKRKEPLLVEDRTVALRFAEEPKDVEASLEAMKTRSSSFSSDRNSFSSADDAFHSDDDLCDCPFCGNDASRCCSDDCTRPLPTTPPQFNGPVPVQPGRPPNPSPPYLYPQHEPLQSYRVSLPHLSPFCPPASPFSSRPNTPAYFGPPIPVNPIPTCAIPCPSLTPRPGLVPRNSTLPANPPLIDLPPRLSERAPAPPNCTVHPHVVGPVPAAVDPSLHLHNHWLKMYEMWRREQEWRRQQEWLQEHDSRRHMEVMRRQEKLRQEQEKRQKREQDFQTNLRSLFSMLDTPVPAASSSPSSPPSSLSSATNIHIQTVVLPMEDGQALLSSLDAAKVELPPPCDFQGASTMAESPLQLPTLDETQMVLSTLERGVGEENCDQTEVVGPVESPVRSESCKSEEKPSLFEIFQSSDEGLSSQSANEIET